MSNQYDRLFDEFDDFRNRMIRAMGVVSSILLWLEKTHPDNPPVSVALTPLEDFIIEGRYTSIHVEVWSNMKIDAYNEGRLGWDRTRIGTVDTYDVNKLDPGIWKG